MSTEQQKIQARHLRRHAYLYVRQSSMRQVMEHQESTKRQYALRQRAVALGWRQEQLIVVDDDQGQSGASAIDRAGFQRLVTEVGLGRAGIVMGLEVSRLARNSSDWHRLLEMCALMDTLILDEDGVYDPAHFNDRLLLGLKGTMSEAELHVLRARLRGGILSKARRGELWSPLPIGLEYDAQGKTVLTPDARIREAVQHFFQTFHRTGSATATVRAFREEGLLFPRRVRGGERKGEVGWSALAHSRALQVLHNPRYAGAFFFGRSRQRKLPDGRAIFERLPRDEWIALIRDAHPGYITWNDFERNLAQLRQNSAAHGQDRRRSPPREGPALLQGILICGRCGGRMTVRYHVRGGRQWPVYVCQRDGIELARPLCQRVHGSGLDEAVGTLLVESMSPVALELALAVEGEVQRRAQDADRLRSKAVQQARYEAELARRRYTKVDPDNRLVADELERDWNDKLRAAQHAQDAYDKQRKQQATQLDQSRRAQILALASDFPALWTQGSISDRDRKRMLRLIVEDVSIIRDRDKLQTHVRFRGGATKSMALPLPKSAWQLRQTSKEVIAEVDQLLSHHPHAQIAMRLNERGLRSGEGKAFNASIVRRIEEKYDLKPRYARLREAGMLTLDEIAETLEVTTATVKMWRRAGLLQAHAYNDKNQYLYEPLGPNAPSKNSRKGVTAALQARKTRKHTNRTHEVQYEA